MAHAGGLRRVALGAALAAAGALVALPSSGLAGVPAIQDDHLTSSAPLDQIPARLQLVKATGAKVARYDIFWSQVAPTKPKKPTNPNDPAYDWSRADLVIDGLAAAGITPIVSVYSTPRWAVQGKNTRFESEYNPNAPRPGDFGQFMQAVAKRYAGKARHFEVWNEPNLTGFFSLNGKSSLPQYKRMVKAAYPRIKAANKAAIVIAGVAGPNNSGRNGNVPASKWLTSLTGDRGVLFDAYSQHIYPSQGPRFYSKSYARAFPSWLSVPYIHQQLDRKKKGMKLYITEAGYTTAATPFRDSTKAVVSPAMQRKYLQQIYNLPAVRSPRTAAVVWFNLQDNVNWPAGLLRENGTKKPSWAAFRALASKAIPSPLRVELSPKIK